ncbi:MAG: HEAT repeat domain-containing protein [Anaerolineae bacterium]|nr:HEAT repeat domain-containing protein [Anaerolineae bacterium]
MRFDPISFLLGFSSASGLSFIIWRSRQRLVNIQQSAESGIEGTREFIGQASHERYRRDMLAYLQRRHLPGNLIKLTDVLLEPRLLPAPPPITPDDSETTVEIDNIFDIVPMFHDLPQSYAPYNIETMALEDLGAGDRHVAILGINGLGKSTTLTTLALMALGDVSFETMADISDRAIREEEEDLSPEERESRAQERKRIQEQALEKLHDAREEQRKQFGQVETEQLPPIAIPGLIPILIHLADIEFDMEQYGKGETLDPAEPLVRAAQRYVTAVTAQVVGNVIYPALASGQALILLDGYDEVAAKVREPYFFWLRQLLATYGHNLIVITGPAEGYAQLSRLGFTPTFLRAWRKVDYNQLARRWSMIWAEQNGVELDEQILRRIAVDNQGRSILDVTVKIWAGLADDTQQTGRGGWYDALINRQLTLPEIRSLLPAMASQVLENGGLIPRRALTEMLTSHYAGATKAPSSDSVIDALLKSDLLFSHAGDMLSFAHPMIASYLAGEILVESGPREVAERALNPAWQDSLAFAAAHVDMLPSMQAKLNQKPDLLYSDLFGMVRWLPDAAIDAAWRGELFKRLAAALMAPAQFPTVRARAIAALVASRDRNVLFILRQALRIPDPYIQRLACLGMGAQTDPEAIRDLAAMLTNENREVQLAAGLALGAIGTDAALQEMAQGLLQGTPELRRAIAEALAALPGEGHNILRDGIEYPDIEIRRAVVYGLSRVQAPWALGALYRAMLQDSEWYVSSAAEDAFMTARAPEREGPRTHPEADSLLWLIEWAADRGEGVPSGENARQVLIRALQEGEATHKITAAKTLGRLGHIHALKALYGSLRDRDDTVRGAAYAALADLQIRLGDPLPGLN